MTFPNRINVLAAALALLAAPAAASETGSSAIFLHPDGMGANTWNAVRLLGVGPDGRLAWDQLPRLAIYVGPMVDSVNASSNGGATTHAFGVRATLDSYGMVNNDVPVSASGKRMSLMQEAQAAGKRVAILNSSSLTEPGTGGFLASVADRDDESEIAAQILAARPDIALGGGEGFFLPKGRAGRHGPGLRTDQRDLIAEARAAGYTVVFDRAELAQVPASAKRVLGLFAHEETFNEATEQQLKARGLPAYQPQAPRFDEMLDFILDRLGDTPEGYLVVGNEEGTDNLSGENNATAALEAGLGADRAIARALEEANRNSALTVVVASDSDNAGLNATGDDIDELPRPLPERTENGSPLDGNDGAPFLAAADARGVRHPFYITWASTSDSAGGTVARGIGPGAELIQGTIDSTAIYRALHMGLFGRELP